MAGQQWFVCPKSYVFVRLGFRPLYQARRIRLARKYLNCKKVMEETGENTPPSA